MIHEILELKPNYEAIPTALAPETPATLEVMIPDHCMDKAELEPLKPAMIVVPGGGYRFVSKREGFPIATQYLAQGFAGFVLTYSVAGNPFPTALLELGEAIRIVRERSAEWGIDPNRVYVIGFSAGGHLAASLAVLWNKGFLGKALGVEERVLRPDGCLLGYPVITPGTYRGGIEEGVRGFSCFRCFDRLLEGLSEKDWHYNALEEQVDSETPPVFLFSTWQDRSVPIEQSLVFAEALQKAGVETELHIFRRGRHGLSTARFPVVRNDTDDVKPFEAWVPLSVTWLEDLAANR